MAEKRGKGSSDLKTFKSGERTIRYMQLTPRCECNKPLVRLETIKLTEDGMLHFFGYCEDECELIVSTCNLCEVLKSLKEHYAPGADNVA